MSQIESRPGTADPRWRGLYLAGAVGAAITALLIPIQMVVFIAWPPPIDGTVADWFAQYAHNPLLGLLNQDLLIMVEEVLLIAIVLALYVTLHRASESLMALAAVGWLMGAVLFIASNTAFEMLSLSNGYAAAATDAQRATYLAAGQGMLASYFDRGTAFTVGYILSSVAGVMVGVAMLRSAVFGRVAAWAVIGGSVLGFGLFVPGIGIVLALLSVLILWAWYALIARTLFHLGRGFTHVAPLGAARRLTSPAA
jgi:hypothetical protein